MERKERLLDFVLFIVSDFEELLNDVSRFFKQPFEIVYKLKDELDDGTFVYDTITKEGGVIVSNDAITTELRTKIKLNEKYTTPVFNEYKDYVEEYLEPLPKKLFIDKNYKENFKTIREFLNKEEESILIEYFNENFCYKYSKEEYKFADELSIEELRNYFERYLKFKNVNDKVYISFFVLLLKGIEKHSKKILNKELDKINKYKKQFNQLEYKLTQEFKELMLERYKKKFFKSIAKNKIEVAGFFQNFESEEVFISFDDTLINQLFALPEDFDDYNLDFKLDSYISHLSLQYLNYSYFAITPEISEEKKTEREVRQLELDEIKKKNSSLISFLNEKGLTDGDINILINLLHENKFSALKIASIEFSREVILFHILYAFYVFDFYEDRLKSIKDFESLVSGLTSFDIKRAEQLMEYYRSYKFGEYSKHYPFDKFQKTLEKIHNVLNIDSGRLRGFSNEIPNQIIEVNKYPEIFASDLGWALFKKLYTQYVNDQKYLLANFSFVFIALEKGGHIHCKQIKFIEFLSQEFDIHIPKIDSRQAGTNNPRYKLYSLLMEIYSK